MGPLRGVKKLPQRRRRRKKVRSTKRIKATSKQRDAFPLPWPRPPDRTGGWDPSRTPSVIEDELAAMRQRDWIAEIFGTGEAAAFFRHVAALGRPTILSCPTRAEKAGSQISLRCYCLVPVF
jgi:hypothetical protein